MRRDFAEMGGVRWCGAAADVQMWFVGGETENSIPPPLSEVPSRAFFEKWGGSVKRFL